MKTKYNDRQLATVENPNAFGGLRAHRNNTIYNYAIIEAGADDNSCDNEFIDELTVNYFAGSYRGTEYRNLTKVSTMTQSIQQE